MNERLFVPGTLVCVRQITKRRAKPLVVETQGVVEAWGEVPTGSWHADGKNGKLWLKRLRLRKVDGELTLLVLDGTTEVAKMDCTSSGTDA